MPPTLGLDGDLAILPDVGVDDPEHDRVLGEVLNMESASRIAPDVTSSGRTRWERSTIGHCGEIPLITAWHSPTHSFPSPKSLRKTMGRAVGIGA